MSILIHFERRAGLVVFFSIAFLAVAAHGQVNSTIKQSVAGIYLAKDDGKGNAGESVDRFEVGDIPIYCVVQLEQSVKTTVKMVFVAAKVPGVKPEWPVVTTLYFLKEGENRVTFFGAPEKKWSVGKYRVDIYLDGKIARDLAFDIGDADAAIKAAKAAPKQQAPTVPVRRFQPTPKKSPKP